MFTISIFNIIDRVVYFDDNKIINDDKNKNVISNNNRP